MRRERSAPQGHVRRRTRRAVGVVIPLSLALTGLAGPVYAAIPEPVPEPNPAGMKMNVGGVEHVHLMPGMLTEAQMKQLDQARGKEFDRLFLMFMIQHHQGAVAMVKQLFDTYGAGQDEIVFKFASDVNVDQSTEIARMEKMLDALKP